MEFQTLYNLSLEDPFIDDVEKGLAGRGILDLENAAHSLKHVGDTQTAIFHAHAAAEKFLKVVLKRSGSNVSPRKLGHRLEKIFEEIVDRGFPYAWLKGAVDSLRSFAPDMEIRYRVVPRTVEDAISAFAAALSICGAVAQTWIFDKARGADRATFTPGSFYVDGRGNTYRCKQLSQTPDNRPAAVLIRFGTYPGFGGLVMEETRDLDESGLYLEIKDASQLSQVKKEYEWQMKHLGKELKPQDLGIETTSGSEGIHTTAVIRIRKALS
jgi:HEPN domain-containing protein